MKGRSRVGFGSVTVLLSAALGGAGLAAQEVETPASFDTGGRVQSLNPQLVERFGLEAPTWPVTGDFVEARLFTLESGGSVIAVQRRDGALVRYPLTDGELVALRTAVDRGSGLTGAVVVEGRPEEMPSEPAGGAFVRNQMVLTWTVYGPLLATLANSGREATALYMLATGGSYFFTSALSSRAHITRAQNKLATDGALRGWAASSGLLYALAGDVSENTWAFVGLAGALGGSIGGYNYGRSLTDSEAAAATTISTLSAATAAGVAGTLSEFEDGPGRASWGAVVAAGVAGYALGPRYPRTSEYAVTQADVQMLNIGAILGAAAALTPIVDADISPSAGFAIVTAGMLAGVGIVEGAIVRGFDYTPSDYNQVSLGLLAGAFMGGGLAILFEPGAAGTMGLVSTGAIAGTIAGHNIAAPRRAGEPFGLRPGGGEGTGRLSFDPGGLAMSLARVPGRHALLSVRF